MSAPVLAGEAVDEQIGTLVVEEHEDEFGCEIQRARYTSTCPKHATVIAYTTCCGYSIPLCDVHTAQMKAWLRHLATVVHSWACKLCGARTTDIEHTLEFVPTGGAS